MAGLYLPMIGWYSPKDAISKELAGFLDPSGGMFSESMWTCCSVSFTVDFRNGGFGWIGTTIGKGGGGKFGGNPHAGMATTVSSALLVPVVEKPHVVATCSGCQDGFLFLYCSRMAAMYVLTDFFVGSSKV